MGKATREVEVEVEVRAEAVETSEPQPRAAQVVAMRAALKTLKRR